jgi:class 3 adenylate cyclase/tetratricopeptide (TPR) repeat protein
MRCFGCATENASGRRFCADCGASLPAACPACGFENQPSDKFCGGCGVRLTATAVPRIPSAAPENYTPKPLAERILRSRAALEGERKQVTVLFADIKGSMELIQGTDPEEARRILDPAVEAMMAAVHRYEGTVNKCLGDGIMALFGAPIAHEDHAVRACYAALAMQNTIRDMAEAVRRRFGVEVQVRTGIHSGEVVVRSIGNDLTMDYDAIGMTTHLASRMEQLALPGTIRMTADTLRLAEGLVQVKPLGPIPVKGMTRPVEIFELTGAAQGRTRLQASAAAGFTRFVGREHEMDALNTALDRAHRGGGQVVGVVGEPGVGKSRLYHEFVHSHRARDWLVLESGSVSHGKATAYLPLIDLLKHYFQIESVDDARRIREKITGKVIALDETLRPALPALLAMLDVPVDDPAWTDSEPAQRRKRTFDACRALLLREAQVQPTIVVLEDLHWMDSESLAFVDSLIENLPKAALLLLVNFRPEFRGTWGAKSYYSHIRIDPLPPLGAAELLRDRLGDDSSLRALREMLIERTQGNPFFLEESARTLIESGALVGSRGDYRLVTPLTAIALPVTVQSVLAARIDRLGPEDKRLLQSASVIGKDFSLALLSEIADADADTLQRGLDNLKGAEFVYETRLFPDPEYTFTHALTHDVAYSGLLTERRLALHAGILDAIERQHAGRIVEHVDRLAYHAGRGEVWHKAHGYGLQAGRKALAQSANRAALEAFQLALAALDRLPETPEAIAENIDLRFALRDAHFVVGDMAPILPHLEKAQALAERIGDRERLALAAVYESGHYWVEGKLQLALEAGMRGLMTAAELDSWELRGLAHYRVGQALLFLGDYADAADHLRKSVAALDHEAGRELFRFGGLTLAFVTTFAAWALAEIGEFSESEALGLMGVELAFKARHAYSISVACFGLAHGWIRQWRFTDAIRVLEQGLEQTKLNSVEAAVDAVVTRLAYAYSRAGYIEQARKLGEDHKILSFALLSSFYFLLPATGFESDRIDTSRSKANEVREIALLRGERGSVGWMEHLLGEIAMAASPPDLVEAKMRYRAAAAIAGELGMRPLTMECHFGIGEVARSAGREQEARSEFGSALALAQAMQCAAAAGKAQRCLADCSSETYQIDARTA